MAAVFGIMIAANVISSSNVGSETTPTSDQTPVQCSKPWPSKIDMIQVPESMVAGQTYTFKAQMCVQNYDTYCRLSPWYHAVNTPIKWTFTNVNGVSVTKDSTSNDPYGIASVDFPCYMAGHWTVTASWTGNANYIEAVQKTSVMATGDTVYWNGFWVTVEKWYKTNDPSNYPTGFQDQVQDPVFVLLKVKNAQNTINTNMHFGNLYVTDTDGQAYYGVSGCFMGTNQFTDGLTPNTEAKVWVCFTVPNNQELTINAMFGVLTDRGMYDGYNGPTNVNVNIRLPAESPA